MADQMIAVRLVGERTGKKRKERRGSAPAFLANAWNVRPLTLMAFLGRSVVSTGAFGATGMPLISVGHCSPIATYSLNSGILLAVKVWEFDVGEVSSSGDVDVMSALDMLIMFASMS